jgi:hypothetical protein
MVFVARGASLSGAHGFIGRIQVIFDTIKQNDLFSILGLILEKIWLRRLLRTK